MGYRLPLATVTSSFGQTVLVTLGIPLLLIGRMALSLMVPNTGLSVAYSIQESLQNLVLLGACVAVVISQYARRRTLQSRLLLIGAATAALVIMVVTPHQALPAYMYPQPSASQRPPVQLVFDPARQTAKESWPVRKNEVGIKIPLVVPGRLADPAVAVDVDGTMVEIEAPGGLRWNSGWQGYGTSLLLDQPYTDTWFGVDKRFFEKVKSSPAKLHIWFALTAFRAKEVHRVVVAADELTTPGGDLCSINSYEEQPNYLQCRSALKHPSLFVTTLSDETTCPPRRDERIVSPGTTFSAWQRSPDSAPAELGFDPIKLFSLSFNPPLGTTEYFRARLCPGTPLTFRILEEGQRTRSELTIDGIRLADYQLNDSPPSTTGIGVAAH